MKASRFYNNLFARVLILLLFSACTSVVQEDHTPSNNNNTDEDEDWLIPSDQVYVGAGRDGIPSIDDPTFIKTSEADFLGPDDLVLGLKIGNQIKAYPHLILDYHEVVNDNLSNIPVSVTYCPLTGSGIAWNRMVDGEETTFGVSGLIHKNNLIAYDRKTGSYWSQMMVQSINGSQMGATPETYHLIEMKWSSWKEAFPNSEVLSGVSGFESNYQTPPYGNYPNDNESILFPIEREDDRLERKAYGHGIFYNSSLQVIPTEGFAEQMEVININANGKEVIVAGSSEHSIAVSFYRKLSDGTRLTLQPAQGEFPVIMEDDEGNKWNVFGEAISGPRKGEELNPIPSYNAYWFAWADFFGSGPKEPRVVYP